MLTATIDFIKLIISGFVESLEGRYKEHVSDCFLKETLVEFIKCAYAANPGDKIISENHFYNAGCTVFESILEHECKGGGNGHHVAQDFAQYFKDWVKINA